MIIYFLLKDILNIIWYIYRYIGLALIQDKIYEENTFEIENYYNDQDRDKDRDIEYNISNFENKNENKNENEKLNFYETNTDNKNYQNYSVLNYSNSSNLENLEYNGNNDNNSEKIKDKGNKIFFL